MRYLILPALLLCAGCATTKQTPPPSVSTAQVIEALSNTKEVLKETGNQNTVVAQKIDKALTLAERLDALLEQIETTNNNKNIVKPE
jgi:TolA-binding protein